MGHYAISVVDRPHHESFSPSLKPMKSCSEAVVATVQGQVHKGACASRQGAFLSCWFWCAFIASIWGRNAVELQPPSPRLESKRGRVMQPSFDSGMSVRSHWNSSFIFAHDLKKDYQAPSSRRAVLDGNARAVKAAKLNKRSLLMPSHTRSLRQRAI